MADINEATHAWVEAFEAEDLARTLTFLTPGAVFVPPNEPAVIGIPAIEAWAQRMLDAVTIEEANTTVEEVRVAENWAVSRGVWRMTVSMDGATVRDTTRYVLIWEQETDGSWKIAYDLWNSSLPLTGGN